MYKNETLKSVSTFLCILETVIEVLLFFGYILPIGRRGIPLSSFEEAAEYIRMHLTSYQQVFIVILIVIIRGLLMVMREYLLNRKRVLQSAFITLFLISILGGIATFFLKVDESSPVEREKKFIEKEYKLGHISEEQYIERINNLEQK